VARPATRLIRAQDLEMPMTRTHPCSTPRLACLALIGALALGACAAPGAGPGTDPIAPAPAARFESGGGSIVEVPLHSGMKAELEGMWEGSYAPYDALAGKITGPVAGVTALLINDIDDTLARGRILWVPTEGARIPAQNWTAALTRTGHFMFLNSHAMMKTQDGLRFFEADIILDDGRSYLHRWVKTAG
jgi:hypothetical protein